MRALIGVAFLFFTFPCSSELHILLDPGHGGIDKGASSGPHQESTITFQVSQILKKLLNKDPNFLVHTQSRHRRVDTSLSANPFSPQKKG